MARATSGTNTQISGVYSEHKGLTFFSMAGWMYRGASGSAQMFGFLNASNTHRTGFFHDTNNVMYVVLANGTNIFTQHTQNITGWHHWALAFDGSQATAGNRLRVYLDGSLLSSNVTAPSTISSNSDNETFRVGRNISNGKWSVGDYAELAMWTETLNDSEVVSLSKGMAPRSVRTGSLMSYIPLVRDIADYVSAVSLTDSSTTVSDHPRVYA